MTHTGSIFLSCLGSHKQGFWMSFQFKASKVRMCKDNSRFHHGLSKRSIDRLFPVSGEGKKRGEKGLGTTYYFMCITVFKFFQCPKVPNEIKRNTMRKKLFEVNLLWNTLISSLPRCLLMATYCSLAIFYVHERHFLSF